MRTARQLRDYISRLESAAYGLRSEAMLRNSPHADAKVKAFDLVIEEGRRARLEAFQAAEQKRLARAEQRLKASEGA